MGAAPAAESLLPAEKAGDAVRVRAFERGDEAKWDAFVASSEEATFFHFAGWRRIIEEVLHHECHYLVAERYGSVCGVLPLARVQSRLFGHSLASLPFCVYGGVAATDNEATRALTSAAVALGETLGVEHLELRNRSIACPDWPRQDLYVTFRKELHADADANMRSIPRKQRAMVRKGIDHGLRSEIDDSVTTFYRLYADNVHRHGTPPLSRRYFAALRDVFGQACEVLTVRDREGKPVSSVLSFYFRNEVLPYYAGDSLAARGVAGNDFKYWELMRRACERGVRIFDYGRSKRDTGSYAFKRNWGFEATPLAYEYRLYKRSAVPENNPLNPKYRALISAWRRLPLPVANAIGPLIVRHLG